MCLKENISLSLSGSASRRRFYQQQPKDEKT